MYIPYKTQDSGVLAQIFLTSALNTEMNFKTKKKCH